MTSYLFLFVGFYLATYQKAPAKPAAKEAARRASSCELPTVPEVAEPAADVVKATAQHVTAAAGINKRLTQKVG